MVAPCFNRKTQECGQKTVLALDACQDLLKSMVGVEVRDFGFKNEKAKENRSETELLPQFQGHLYIKFLAVYW